MIRSLFVLIILSLSPASAFAGVDITTDAHYRYITSDGLPNHEHGEFPNAHNPNTIAPQDYHFRVPLEPQLASAITQVKGRQLFGVALNGVPFDPGTAEFWNNDPSSGWNYDALAGAIDLGIDMNNAHVQPNGAYHYHGVPNALAGEPLKHSPLIGYAADGFPVYTAFGYYQGGDPSSGIIELRSSYHLIDGLRPYDPGPGGKCDGSFVQDYEYTERAGDLDECNGRQGVTPEYPQGTYYYVLTSEFPFVPRCLKGTPDASFLKSEAHGGRPGGPQGQGPQGQGGRRTPPPEALSACEGSSEGSSCGFDTPRGRMNGTCRTVPEGVVACVPER